MQEPHTEDKPQKIQILDRPPKGSLCTSRGCDKKATQWKIVRVNGLDEQHSKCEDHGRSYNPI